MTETSYTIQQRLGVLKGIAAGEGAQFFLLSREAGEHPLAEIQGIETFIGKQTTEEISSRIIRFLQRNGLECQDIQCWLPGKTRSHTIKMTLTSKLLTMATLFMKSLKQTFSRKVFILVLRMNVVNILPQHRMRYGKQ